jgi:hypothetical protein
LFQPLHDGADQPAMHRVRFAQHQRSLHGDAPFLALGEMGQVFIHLPHEHSVSDSPQFTQSYERSSLLGGVLAPLTYQVYVVVSVPARHVA